MYWSDQLQAQLVVDDTKDVESMIKELKTIQKDAIEKSNCLRKAFHDNLDKYFDSIDERIASFFSKDLKTFQSHHQDITAKLKVYADLTANMDKLTTENDGKLLLEGVKLLNEAKKLLQSPLSSSIDAVEIPQVHLERVQDLNLKGAVDLQLLQGQNKVPHVRMIYLLI